MNVMRKSLVVGMNAQVSKIDGIMRYEIVAVDHGYVGKLGGNGSDKIANVKEFSHIGDPFRIGAPDWRDRKNFCIRMALREDTVERRAVFLKYFPCCLFPIVCSTGNRDVIKIAAITHFR